MTGTHSAEQDQQSRQPIHINPIAVIAGALASLSAAVVASYFGVAGTLIGPAVMSVISSVAAAVYAGLLGHTRRLVERGTVSVRQALPELVTRGRRPDSGNGPRDQERGVREAAARAARWRLPGLPAALAHQRRRWLVVAGMAVLIFALAIGAVTAIEAAIKEPIASALGVRGRGQARTSVGVVVSHAGGSETTSSPPSSSAGRQAPSSTSGPSGQTPPTTKPGPSTTGGTQPPPTVPPTTAPSQTSTPSTPPSTGGGTSATAP
jgi:hypothetical protein